MIERKLLQTSSRALQTLKSSQDAMVDDEKVDSYDSAISQLESAFEAINKSVIKAEKGWKVC